MTLWLFGSHASFEAELMETSNASQARASSNFSHASFEAELMETQCITRISKSFKTISHASFEAELMETWISSMG